MLINSNHGANTSNNRWYYLGYDLTFFDLDKHRIITNDDVRGIEDPPMKFLIINVRIYG